MVIRQMDSLDLRATNRLLAESIALQQPRGEKPQSAEAIYRRLRDRSLPTTYEGKLRYLVAEIGRKVVGLCVFYTYSDGFVGYADVRDLYVSPPHRRRGIGAPCCKRPRRRPPKTAARLGIRFYPDPYIGYLLLYSLPLLVLDCLQLVLAVVGVSLVFMAVDWSRYGTASSRSRAVAGLFSKPVRSSGLKGRRKCVSYPQRMQVADQV